jgi:hypothetical protein
MRLFGLRFSLAALLVFALACGVSGDEFDAPPVAHEFRGTVSGTINWALPQQWFFMLWPEKFEPKNGDAKKFDSLLKLPQGLKVAISWEGANPVAAQNEWLKTLKPGQRVSLKLVPGYEAGVRLAEVPIEKPDANRVLASQSVDPLKAGAKATGAKIDESKIKKIIRVDATGKGDAKTFADGLKLAADSLREGVPTKLIVGNGLYREGEITIDGGAMGGKARETLFVVEGAQKGKATISGSVEYSPASWKAVKDANGKIKYYERDWPYQWGNWGGNWGEWNPTDVRSHRREIVFFNGEALKQELLETYTFKTEAKSAEGVHTYTGFRQPDVLKPGSFGVAEREENGRKIYLVPPAGSDFSKAKIEVGVQTFLLNVTDKQNFVLRNLNFEHAASPMIEQNNARGAVSLGLYHDWNLRVKNVLVEGCDFRWNGGNGLVVTWIEGLTLRRSVMNYNGAGGAGGNLVHNFIWEDNDISFNQWRGFETGLGGWGAAGLKLHNTRNGIFRRNTAIGNLALGYWFDINCLDFQIDDLVAAGNFIGLFLEISKGPILVKNSLLCDNTEKELLINNSTHVRLQNNIFYRMPQSSEAKATDIAAAPADLKRDRAAVAIIYYYRDIENDHMAGALNDPQSKIIFKTIGPLQFHHNIMANMARQDWIMHHQYSFWPGEGEEFQRENYEGRGNVFHSITEKPFVFRRVKDANQLEDAWTLKEWEANINESEARSVDSLFMNPKQYDFRVKANSPLNAQAKQWPAARRYNPQWKTQVAKFHQKHGVR